LYIHEEIFTEMPKDKKRIKLKQFRPVLNMDEFHALAELLFVALKENNTACAQALGISTKTWLRWNRHPPAWPWWNIVLREAIRQIVSSLEASRASTRKHRNQIIRALTALPSNDTLAEDLGDMAYTRAGAQTHLRNKLLKRGMWKDELFQAANMGGYSPKSLEVAARALEIVKTQEGFGKDKRSFWRLPTEDDD
jgi:hypothetical protein